ncbi:Helix-turn-helix domain protein [Sporomusa ovata DSM 2662]|uniref:Helix-turn-helix domain-containing protein n=1 Tax=Sporomusa ovata TaxID=2378 RepID=A0A0U1KXB2_9FIRM|nr:helix-turn-helix domain-containing protein [Sporomusa ovata]EQB28221.1 DNA binding domain, excisionase family [Sporomusa ovata DSM 2662]CQR71759.1 hypothetical protein SpAn4DRAFT_3625 [Sporomusa ovata]
MELLTPKEAAQILKVEYVTVIKWLNEGEIQGFKLRNRVNSKWRIERQDLEKFQTASHLNKKKFR